MLVMFVVKVAAEDPLPDSLPHEQSPHQPQEPSENNKKKVPSVESEPEVVEAPSTRQVDVETPEGVVTVAEPETSEEKNAYYSLSKF